MPLLVQLVIGLFSVVVVIGAILFLGVDMFGRVDYIKEQFPLVGRVLEKRSAMPALLAVVMFLLIGVGIELYQKEFPDIRPPIVRLPSPIIQVMPTIHSPYVNRKNRLTIPLPPESLHAFKGALLDTLGTKINMFEGEYEEAREKILFEQLSKALSQLSQEPSKWSVTSSRGGDESWTEFTNYKPRDGVVIVTRLKDANAVALLRALEETGIKSKLDVKPQAIDVNGKPLEGILLMIGRLN